MKPIDPCPYCPMGGDVSVACTDLKKENEYQVWCRTCWAHGPSRKTADEAIDDWNDVADAKDGAEERRM